MSQRNLFQNILEEQGLPLSREASKTLIEWSDKQLFSESTNSFILFFGDYILVSRRMRNFLYPLEIINPDEGNMCAYLSKYDYLDIARQHEITQQLEEFALGSRTQISLDY